MTSSLVDSLYEIPAIDGFLHRERTTTGKQLRGLREELRQLKRVLRERGQGRP